MNVLMAKLCSDVFLGIVLEHVKVGLCVVVCVCGKEKVRDIQGLCIIFSRKAALISITIKIIHVLSQCLSFSALYSFVSVCQSDCLTVSALIKLSGDKKSSLQSVHK